MRSMWMPLRVTQVRFWTSATARRRYRAALCLASEAIREHLLSRLRTIAETSTADDLGTLRRAVMDADTDGARALAYFELGAAAWFEANDHREAVAAFEAAASCDPTMVSAVEMLVTVLVARHDFGKLEALCARLADADDAASAAAPKRHHANNARPCLLSQATIHFTASAADTHAAMNPVSSAGQP